MSVVEVKPSTRMIRSYNMKLTNAMKRLKTDKQRQFVLEYNVCGDTKQAYQAIYKSQNWRNGHAKLMRDAVVLECLELIDARDAESNMIKKEEVLLHLYYAVTRNVEDLIDDDGILIENMSKLSERAKACVDGIEQKKFYDEDGNMTHIETKVKLVPKAKALEMAMKHKGLFAPEQHEHKVTVDLSNLPVQGAQGDPVQDRIDAEYKTLPSDS